MNLLFSIDDTYVDQWKVTLFSIVHNSNFQELSVYILQKEALTRNAEILDFCKRLGVTYYPVIIGKDEFQDAPTSKRYPETIYYRLLAHEYLPQNLDKVLYIDADILCLNDISTIYEMKLDDFLYAAASHIADSNIRDLINKARLGNFGATSYVNSGVLLMNLEQIRKTVKREDIMDYIATNGPLLFLPDQDVLNALYGHQILLVADEIYNFDARYHAYYYAKTAGLIDADWIVQNTVFLHYCGKDKPWKKNARGKFSFIYKHYQRLTHKV